MDLRHARTFVTVAELGTVSKAAQQLHIAQPALSRQIADLEQELGLKLFDRVGRRLLLTGEGEQLLGDCRALLSCATAVSEHARQLQRGDTGVLKVAGSPQIIEGAVAEFLTRYAEHYPKVQVKLSEAIGWAETAAMLERGEIHLGINLMRAVQPDDRTVCKLHTRAHRSAGGLSFVDSARQGWKDRDCSVGAISIARSGNELCFPPQLRRRVPARRVSSRRSPTKAEHRTRSS